MRGEARQTAIRYWWQVTIFDIFCVFSSDNGVYKLRYLSCFQFHRDNNITYFILPFYSVDRNSSYELILQMFLSDLGISLFLVVLNSPLLAVSSILISTLSLLLIYLKSGLRLLVLSRRPQQPLKTCTFLRRFLSSTTHRQGS